jgi:hypothetical protein
VLNDELLPSRFVAAQNPLHQPFVLPVSHRPRLPSTNLEPPLKRMVQIGVSIKNLASVVNHTQNFQA